MICGNAIRKKSLIQGLISPENAIFNTVFLSNQSIMKTTLVLFAMAFFLVIP